MILNFLKRCTTIDSTDYCLTTCQETLNFVTIKVCLIHCFYVFRIWLYLNLLESHIWIASFSCQWGVRASELGISDLWAVSMKSGSPMEQLGAIPRSPRELWPSHRTNRSSSMHQDMLGRDHVHLPARTREVLSTLLSPGVFEMREFVEDFLGLQKVVMWGAAYLFKGR